MTENLPALYGEIASWWPLLSAPSEYAEEAAFYGRLLQDNCEGEARSLLELGSGGGNNASYLKKLFTDVALVDASDAMLDVSRTLNPECEHHHGDMRSVRLERQFDCIFVHDAVCYMTTEDDLRRALETAFVHCRFQGVAVLAPDYVRETFKPSTDHGGHDGGAQGLRYLEWVWDPDPTDTTYTVDYAYLLREADGAVRVVQDRHIEGLFARDMWLELMSEVGFDPKVVPFEHSEVDWQPDVFVAVKR